MPRSAAAAGCATARGPSTTQAPEPDRIAAIVLAAGGSRRLGQAKQLLCLDGEPLVRRTARLALEAGAAPVWVVLGAEAARVRAAAADLPVRWVENPHWEEGVASSIRAGVAAAAAEEHPPAALLILLVDQLRVDAPLLERLLATRRSAPGRRVACAYAGGLGVPAVFPAPDFPALAALRGDRGARELLRAEPGRVAAVPFPGGAVDVDRPGDAADLG